MARGLAGDETGDRGVAGLTGEPVVGNLLPDSGPSARGLKASGDLLKVQRAVVEEAIRLEEAALTETIELLAMAMPWAEWSERLRRTLRTALTDAGEGVEAHKLASGFTRTNASGLWKPDAGGGVLIHSASNAGEVYCTLQVPC